MASRLRRQANRHCIRIGSILKTKVRRGETAETRIERVKLGDETELMERKEPERKQPETIIAEADLDALRTYILDLARTGAEKLQDKPSAAKTDGLQTHDHVQIPLDVTVRTSAVPRLQYLATSSWFWSSPSCIQPGGRTICCQQDDCKGTVW